MGRGKLGDDQVTKITYRNDIMKGNMFFGDTNYLVVKNLYLEQTRRQQLRSQRNYFGVFLTMWFSIYHPAFEIGNTGG